MHNLTVEVHYLHNDPNLAVIGVAAARRGDRLVVVVDAGMSQRRQRRALLHLMTSEEYAVFAALRPVA